MLKQIKKSKFALSNKTANISFNGKVGVRKNCTIEDEVCTKLFALECNALLDVSIKTEYSTPPSWSLIKNRSGVMEI